MAVKTETTGAAGDERGADPGMNRKASSPRSFKDVFVYLIRLGLSGLAVGVAFGANLVFAGIIGLMATRLFNEKVAVVLFLLSFLCSNAPIYLALGLRHANRFSEWMLPPRPNRRATSKETGVV